MNEKGQREAFESLATNIKIKSTFQPGTNKLISDIAVKKGLFYQDITDTGDSGTNERDLFYISYGLFEDLFLNGIIADNKDLRKNSVTYNTKDTLIRYETNLVARQNENLDPSEELPLFLYPDDWKDSFNGVTGDDEFKTQKSKGNQYKTPNIPLREVFISAKLISEKFKAKQNVNDALEAIYEAINSDSYGVIQLKMIPGDNSFSSLSAQDVNLIPIPGEKEEMLIFDVTSDQSIVSNMNYSYEMPKGGLSSTIAIGEKGDFEFFNDAGADNLNFIRILNQFLLYMTMKKNL